MSDDVQLGEMLDACLCVDRYLAEYGGETAFLGRGVLFDAVCMNLVRIGEGVRLLSPGVRDDVVGDPWPEIIALRKRVAHGYARLRPDMLWRIASLDVPALRARIERALGPGA